MIKILYFILTLPGHIVLWPVELLSWLDDQVHHITSEAVLGLSYVVLECLWIGTVVLIIIKLSIRG
jgi:hypothetical protein